MPTGGTAALTRFLVHAGDEGPVTIPRVPAREAAERELSKPMYQEHEPGLFQRALDWFWERVDDLLSAASGAAPGGMVGIVVIALVVVLLAIALRLRLGALRRTPTTGGTLFDDRPRSAAEHREAAERHASENRWDQALQERMRAIVRSLEERALLDPRPGRTADEAAAEAGRSLPDHAEALEAAARAFDDVTYGGRAATADAYARLVELDTALRRSKPRLDNALAGGAR
ncbi:DUF4129 domain-containing protein [Streptomyces sp. NPDC051776]|uniref:DUF4129 domain-containing protein n=1 Tax=Streptomyces sp. NPDC051776 TaxID=3155414 RepID=UPI00341A95C8